MTSVQALVCSEVGRLILETREIQLEKPGHVLVRPRRVGICGTDFHIFEGKHPFLRYPRVMGHELAVEVVEAPQGSAVSVGQIYVVNPYLSCGRCHACRMGKPNCCVSVSVLGVHEDGGMTELLSVPADNLLPAPGLTADECAGVEFLAIGAHAVRRGAVAPGDRVLVVGAGPIGFGVCLFARLSGGHVVVHDRSQERGVDATDLAGVQLLPKGADLPEMARDFTDGDGFDVVFDATGSRVAMERGFDCVGNGGRYVLVSVVAEPVTFQDSDFHRKELSLHGSRNATAEDFERVMTAMRAGEVPIDRLITHRTSLRQAVTDLPRWAQDKTGLLKAVIEFN